ncbi:TetR/AcrR family transcriptional regulator [Bifidobacterium sp. ESL0690]|uniref:TetR/AcrR family transcriptional regulator n=1 Tax=Bifidobacterium sp. ESL0690 TaxID=2983214 RepID=UPI0023F850D9|nr:TetR/AcrR family transcriptional regulator [Bifidobacterium sp. ESL0690]WEV47436.1 TetR/AcrR family transcriptional regulator [Bifidobacterium sp. ESL0690]
METAQDNRGTSPTAVETRKRWQSEKKRATRRHIRRCALDLFTANGYDNVTIKEIAAKAEVTPITLFRYFPRKEDIVLTLPTDDSLWERLQDNLATATRQGNETFEVFRATVDGMLVSIDPEFLGSLARRLAIVRADSTLQEALYAKIPSWSGKIAENIGGNDDPFHTEFLATGLVELAISLMLEWSRRREKTAHEPDAELIVTILQEMSGFCH